MTITAPHPGDEFQSVRIEPYRMDLTPDEIPHLRDRLPLHRTPRELQGPANAWRSQDVHTNGAGVGVNFPV